MAKRTKRDDDVVEAPPAEPKVLTLTFLPGPGESVAERIARLLGISLAQIRGFELAGTTASVRVFGSSAVHPVVVITEEDRKRMKKQAREVEEKAKAERADANRAENARRIAAKG